MQSLSNMAASWLITHSPNFLLWTNADITYCYAAKTARGVKKPYADTAINVWHRHEAHSPGFRFKESTKSWRRTPVVGEECTSHPQRELILVTIMIQKGDCPRVWLCRRPAGSIEGPALVSPIVAIWDSSLSLPIGSRTWSCLGAPS